MKNNVDLMLLDISNPTVEEIMKDDFTLPGYFENELKKNPNLIDIDDVWDDYYVDDNLSKEKDELEDVLSDMYKLEARYYYDVDKIIWSYLFDLKMGFYKDDIYTNKLKELTKNYLKDVKEFEVSHKNKILLDAFRKVLDSKKREKAERIQKYNKNEISFKELYFDDLDLVKMDLHIRQTLSKFKRIISASSKDSDLLERKFYKMTIGEFLDEYFKNKGKMK